MDKDDYFKIVEEASCFNVENFILNKEWASMAILSHTHGEIDDNYRNSQELNDLNESKKGSKKEKGALKLLE